jgi:hypothetical protein
MSYDIDRLADDESSYRI